MEEPQALEVVTKEKLMEDLRTLAHDAEHLCKELATGAKEKTKRATGRAFTAAKSSAALVSGKTAECMKATGRTVKENPYAALGVALGLGLLVGFLFRTRE